MDGWLAGWLGGRAGQDRGGVSASAVIRKLLKRNARNSFLLDECLGKTKFRGSLRCSGFEKRTNEKDEFPGKLVNLDVCTGIGQGACSLVDEFLIKTGTGTRMRIDTFI